MCALMTPDLDLCEPVGLRNAVEWQGLMEVPALVGLRERLQEVQRRDAVMARRRVEHFSIMRRRHAAAGLSWEG